MHIYMQPLIDELLELYNTGITAHDFSAPGERTEFTLKAALLWTIHDWPGTSPAILCIFKYHDIIYKYVFYFILLSEKKNT